MRHVLDASVAIAAVRRYEPAHRAARARVAALLTGAGEIAVPAIFSIEVSETGAAHPRDRRPVTPPRR
jgi:predicted nucleic acid-binding protein